MDYIIYTFKWNCNEYFYIGQTTNFSNRWRTHLDRVKSSKRKLYHVWRKYGPPSNIEFEYYSSTDELNIREQELLDSFFDSEFCLNLCPQVGCPRGFKHTEEFKKQKSARMKQTWLEGKFQNQKKYDAIIVIDKDENGIVFDSISEACQCLDLQPHRVCDAISGRDRHKRTKGFEVWDVKQIL